MPRRARLPMLLGLAALTALAHALAAAAHAATHAALDWPLLLLLALGPLAGILLATRDRPRHGAVVLAMSMLAAAVHTLWAHFVVAGHLPTGAFAAWSVQLMLAFELQGAALGLVLIAKPQVPRAPAAEA